MKDTPTVMITETQPLLVKPTPPPSPPLNSAQRIAITLFASVRVVRGLAFIAWPAIGLSSFDIPTTGATFLLGALLGSRDFLLGGLLWTADLDAPSRREVRRALLVNLLSDAMDTCILIFSAACSWHWRNPFIEIGLAAVLAVAEHLTLWSMDEDTDDGAAAYVRLVQAGEDKQRRMDSWLTELRAAEEQSYRPASTVAESHAGGAQ